MILSRYIAHRFWRMFLITAAGLALILFFIDLIEQMRRFGSSGIGLGGASRLSLLQLAGTFYTILTLVTLLAAIGLFLVLGRNSELVAIRATGRSALRFLAAPAAVAFLIGVLAVALLNPISAATAKRYSEATAALARGGDQTIGVGEDVVWLRQALGAQGAQMVIRAARASPDATSLFNATFLIFDARNGPVRRIAAGSARLVPGAWVLSDVKSWPLTEPNPEAAATVLPRLELPSDLTAERIRDAFGAPGMVPIWQLPAFISGLEKAGFSAQPHRVWFQAELARPALMAAMVLIAAAFTMNQIRGQGSGRKVLAAFLAGVGLFFLQHFAQVLGDNGSISALLAAWAPPTTGILLALGRLLRLEDG